MAIKQRILTKGGHETVTLTPMSAIRKKCLDCCCWSANEVKLCELDTCPLHSYRLGKKPDQVGRTSKGGFKPKTDGVATL